MSYCFTALYKNRKIVAKLEMSQFTESSFDSKNGLIVRVKRKRTQDVAEFIMCVANEENDVKRPSVRKLTSDILAMNTTNDSQTEGKSNNAIMMKPAGKILLER